MIYDCDISGADWSEPNIDDLVWFDGWVNGEWNNLGYPYDSVTLLQDTFLNLPDGVYDQYQVFGDDFMEHTIHNDTLIIPRNMSFMWDGDDPLTPGNDTGENGASAGFAGLRLIYAPPSPADSIWIDSYGDTARIVRAWAHQSLSYVGTDEDLFKYLAGHHPATGNRRFVYKPSSPYDFGWLLSSGLFKISNGETLKFVFAVSVGQGLNGGYDAYWYNSWKRGLRQRLDFTLSAYYSGSLISDPYHPSDPDEDIHWKGGYDVAEKILPVRGIILNTLPNIISKSLKLSFTAPVKNLKMDIFDVSGKKVKKIVSNQEGNSFSFDLNSLSKGVYFLHIKTDKNEFSKRIIILRK